MGGAEVRHRVSAAIWVTLLSAGSQGNLGASADPGPAQRKVDRCRTREARRTRIHRRAIFQWRTLHR